MRIVFTGGGSAGHVLPNLAVIEELGFATEKSSRPRPLCSYIGEHGGPEEELAREAGIEFHGIHAGKLRRYFDLQNFIDVFKIPFGFFEALALLRRLRPDLVFSKGGYVSVPVVFAARTLGIPVWIHESDSTPGLATKLAVPFAEKIFLAFEEAAALLRGRSGRTRVGQGDPVVVGNPVRRAVLHGSTVEGRRLTGFDAKKPVVLVMGGSLGALSLNEKIFQILPELLKIAQVVHITGRPSLSEAKLISAPEGRSITKGEGAPKPPYPKNYSAFEFLDAEKLAHIYAITDGAISRAGAGAIFELLTLHIPMLLVPLPRFASRGDQIENAHIFEHRGFARYLDQDMLTGQKFFAAIQELLEDKKARAEMIAAQKAATYKNAAQEIAEAMMF